MRRLLAALAFLPLLTLPVAAGDDEPLTQAQIEAIRALVHDYIMSNPELVEDALIALDERREQERLEEQRAAIAAAQDRLLHDERDFAVGPEDARVTIVEFFDYNCAYCKRSADWVRETLDAYPQDVRFIFKETPIFADEVESSGYAARAALASQNQNKYLDLHFALMAVNGDMTIDQVKDVARSKGLNIRWLDRDAGEEGHDVHVEENLTLAREVGMRGTPTFIVNGELVGGAHLDRLDGLVQAGLAGEG